MAKEDVRNDLLYEVGDQARDQLADQTPPIPAMERVFEAEERLLACREELETLETQLNETDALLHQFLADREAEKKPLREVVRRFRRAVDAIEGKVKDSRRKLAAARTESRANRDALKAAEARLVDLEMSSPEAGRVEQAKLVIKRMRVQGMRKDREIEELEQVVNQGLTPAPGQPGAEGINAHRRLLEMEDEERLRREETEEKLGRIDASIAGRERELQGAEEELNAALFRLGEACYAKRISHPKLSPLYAKLDKLK
jgi:hypothetical protein